MIPSSIIAAHLGITRRQVRKLGKTVKVEELSDDLKNKLAIFLAEERKQEIRREIKRKTMEYEKALETGNPIEIAREHHLLVAKAHKEGVEFYPSKKFKELLREFKKSRQCLN